MRILVRWIIGIAALTVVVYVGFASLHHFTVDTSRYNYDQFSASQYGFGDDLAGPQAGERAIDFSIVDIDGNQHSLSDYEGRYVVLETGSITCPMYVARIDPMNAVAQAHPDVVFLTLYVREAHPGTKIGAHDSFEDKLNLAKRVKSEEREARIILVDGITGDVHRSYGAWPNMIYVIAPDGTVAFRGVWNDAAIAEEVISRLKAGESIDDIQPSGPRNNSFEITQRVLTRAGGHAVTDFVAGIGPAAVGHLFEASGE